MSPWTTSRDLIVPGVRWKRALHLIPFAALLAFFGYVLAMGTVTGLDAAGGPFTPLRWLLCAALLGGLSVFLAKGVRGFIRNGSLVIGPDGFRMEAWKEQVAWDRAGAFVVRRPWWAPFWARIEFPLKRSDGKPTTGMLPGFFSLPVRELADQLEAFRVRYSPDVKA